MLVLIALILLVKYYKKQSFITIFSLGFVIGLAITIHFQATLITSIALLALIVSKDKLKSIGYLAIGLFIPFLPFIYFDIRFSGFWAKSVFIFFAIDQYSRHIPNRWLTYIGTDWPVTWSTIIGGSKYIGGLLISLITAFTILNLKSFSKNKLFYLVAITFSLEVLLFRYYKGEREVYYSFFSHPSVIVLTAWVCIQVFKIHKSLGLILIGLILYITLGKSAILLKSTSISISKVNDLKQEIYSKYPNKQFDIFGCHDNADALSKPLALAMYYDGLNSINGTKIGVCETSQGFKWQVLTGEDLQKKDAWFNNSTANVYQSNVEWYKDNPPKSGGDFWGFIKRKLSPRCWPQCN